MPVLQTFTKEDIPTYLEDLKNKDSRFLIQFAGARYKFPLTSETILQDINDSNYLLFKFVSDSGQNNIGYCQITRINWKEKFGSIGRVFITDEYRGKRFSYLMLEQLITYAIEELGFSKLSLRVFDFNIPAKKCYTKLGFIEVHTEKEYLEEIEESWSCITMEKRLS